MGTIGAPLTSIVVKIKYYGSQWCPRTALFPTFFRISSFVFSRLKKCIQVWNYLRVRKWWQNFNLWVNYPFKVSRLTFGNLNLQVPPQIFYGIQVWRLARPLQDQCFFLSHSFVAFAMCFGSLSPFSMPWPWRYMAPSIVPLKRCSCPVPLAKKHPQSIMCRPPGLTMGMVFLGS